MDPSLANAALRPPVLDGTNYSLWKVKIWFHIKSIDERAWQRVLSGWTPPRRIDEDSDSLIKPESDWTTDEVQILNYKSKALNAIFSSVDTNMFGLITNCVLAKDAWDILQRHCEGPESVRRKRLRIVTSKFEMMRMEESENILEYYRRLRKIANEAFSLGDPISNERLVSKVLRSLPERFNIKICVIDEAKNTTQMALEDLISSLRTFEMNIDMQKKDKGKTIAFQASNDTYNDLLQISQEVSESDLCEDSISFITKKFGDYLKRIRDKKKEAQPSKFPSLPAPERPQRFPAKQQSQPRNEGREQFNSKKYDSVQCRECNGFGHYANECAKRLRKNKGYNVSLSDEKSDEEEKSNDEDNHTSLTALLTENRRLQEELFEDWTKRNKLNSTLVKENTDLKVVVAKLEVILSKKDLELGKTKEELQKATETLSKFNSSTSKLGSILSMGRDDKKGLGFKDSVHETGESPKSTVFVKGKTETFTPPQPTPSTKSSPPKIQSTVPVPKRRKRRDDRMNQKSSWMLSQMWFNTSRNTSKNRPTVTGTRSSDNCYQIGEELSCKHAQITELDLWHQKLGHVNFKTLKNLSKYEAVRGVSNLSSGIPYVCGECQKGKQTRVSHPVLATSGTTRCQELLYMDLMGPMEVESCGGKKYSFVCVDDFSRYSWVSFIREKSNTFSVFKQLVTRITNFHGLKVRRIRTDHGKEFENSSFSSFCDRKGISHEFSAPKTPKQNGIAERKNRTLQEMARVMLTSKNISKHFWAEALNTACHISNRVYLRSGSTMTSYEIIMGKKPNLKYFHIFGCVCYTLNDRDQLAKFDSKNIKKKTAEDDVEDLLENPNVLENAGVAPDVATPSTTRDTEVVCKVKSKT
ncbi:uncharacterized protein LOC142556908 [Primulina tabacum]|uniref:uncharacterized protein LOC142556908 n=1 Tax=Primulina tabacum TaxID=48773 RepID=UPI003F590FD3